MITEVTTWSINDLMDGRNSVITYIGPGGTRFHLSGGHAPILGAQNGVNAQKFKGLMAPGKHITQQGARQDGDDWNDAVYDPLEIDFQADIGARTPAEFRMVHREWFDEWDMKLQGRLVWFTREMGEWWTDVRLMKEISDELAFGPAHMTQVSYQWAARADFPFWQSFDSTSSFTPTSASQSGFFTLLNRGDQDQWPRYLFQGPGTITLGDGLTGNTAVFGPLKAGQMVLITTLPRKRSIVEINTTQNLYPLLKGRFTSPLPPVNLRPEPVRIPVSITGATVGVSKVIASLTPIRKWPE